MTETDALVERLLPCPFCGGEAARLTLTEPGYNFGGDVIVCTGMCQASSHVEFGRKENLVSLWNTRPPAPAAPDTMAGVVEALRKMLRDWYAGGDGDDVFALNAKDAEAALATLEGNDHGN